MTDPTLPSPKRRTLLAAAAAAATLGAPAVLRAQTPKIRIGYWPVAAGLPF